MDIAIERRGAIEALGFHRPARRNAITRDMYTTLGERIAAAEADDSVRVILFHGLPDVFTSGNDIEDFMQHPPTGQDAPVFRFLTTVADAKKPMVAAVTGPAVGIGTTLLLHCEMVFAGDNARFAMPFTQLGLVPEFASSYLLPLVAGYQRAAELLMLGEPFDAAKAYEAGFVTRVVPAAEALDAAWQAATKIAALPPKSIMLTKSLLKASRREIVRATLAAEAEHFHAMLTEPAARAALSAFLARRKG